MPIEIIPKERAKEKTPLFSMAVVFFLIVAAMGINFGLVKYYQNKWNKNLIELKQSLAKKNIEEVEKIESEILIKKEKIELFQKVFSKYIKTSPVLTFLKENCHRNVYFKEVKFTTSSKTLELFGRAENLTVLAEQIAIFQESDFVSSVKIKEVKISPEDGKINFMIEIIFNDNIFIS